ncbi:MAG: zinc ribbon domain-containing protein [Verrucomicrobiota bacterium]
MPTYVYETIPKDDSEKAERFEISQRIADPTLTEHPDTGKPVRRLIVGGYLATGKGSGSGSCCATKSSCCK